jgi:hypothetical protein
LKQASDALLAGRCETELPGLAELIDRSTQPDTRARARILRARCFTHLAREQKAKREYQLYLRDFPNGAWAGEAQEAGAQTSD